MKVYIVQKIYQEKTFENFSEILGTFTSEIGASEYKKEYIKNSYEHKKYEIKIQESDLLEIINEENKIKWVVFEGHKL